MDNHNKQLEEFKIRMENELNGKLERLPDEIKYEKEISQFKKRLEKILQKELKNPLQKEKNKHAKDCCYSALR